MFFPPPGPIIVNLPNPIPPQVPIPTDNIPKKKKQGWPIRVPKVTPSEKVPSKVKVPSKANVPSKTKVPSKIKVSSASPIPLNKDDKNSNNKRQPKDASQKIKRSKNSKSPVIRGNNSFPVPPRVQSPLATPAGPSGAIRSRSRSPLVSNTVLEVGPNDNNGQEGEDEDEEYEEEGDCEGFFTQYTLIPMFRIR